MKTISLAVGEIYRPLVGKQECTTVSIDKSGILLCLNFSQPTEKEIAAWGKGHNLDLRFCIANGILLLLAKADDLPWIDAPLDPQFTIELNKLRNPTLGYALTIILTSAPDGNIKQLRLVGLEYEFSRRFKIAVDEFILLKYDREEYLQRLQALYSERSTNALVDLSLYRCYIKGK